MDKRKRSQDIGDGLDTVRGMALGFLFGTTCWGIAIALLWVYWP
jgi:hypothetical protein